jgi:hypothetical protein
VRMLERVGRLPAVGEAVGGEVPWLAGVRPSCGTGRYTSPRPPGPTVGVGALAVRRAAQLVLLLRLHPPVLEPDLDLSLAEAEVVRDLYPASPRQVTVEVELLLQLEGLVARVGLPGPLRTGGRRHLSWGRGEERGRGAEREMRGERGTEETIKESLR